MTDSFNVSSKPGESSLGQFVCQLREKSERAAEASIHYATLSQHHLELSGQLSRLAEQADSIGLPELRRTLQALEKNKPKPGVRIDAEDGDAESDSPHTAPKVAASVAATATGESSAMSVSKDRTADIDVVEEPKSRQLGKRKDAGRNRTRRLVDRTRNAKRSAGRVKVKAKKADLKPKLRTATEELKNGGSSIATSLGLLALVSVVMSLVTWQLEIEVPLQPIVSGFAAEVIPVEEEALPIEPPEEEQGEQLEEDVELIEEPVEPEEVIETPEAAELPSEDVSVPEASVGQDAAASDAATEDTRSDAGRKAMLKKYGGSAASESSVMLGLEWLVSVQHARGYWDFVSVGASGNAGTINNPIGATAYALLPFLSAGQTHKDGQYKKNVAAGLKYLTTIGVNAPAGYDLRGMINKQSDDDAPNEAYYVHGAATLALCEAYGMTKDRQLKRSAERAVKFLVNSQDPKGGGWRYNPQEAGSTSVTAIQLMALMAAKKAGIDVPDRTLKGVSHYLDSVQVDGAGRYGYEVKKKQYKGALTAMALLCRMYLGWGRDDGDMRAGVALLDKAGPYDNLYTLYFATQVMKNWGGAEWERWNSRLRDDLIACQETAGAAKGSWKPRTGAIHAKQGGRLLTTALATLTLEVYYRYTPLLPEQPPGIPAMVLDD